METDDISEQYIITNTHLRKECKKTVFRIMQNKMFSIFRFVQLIPSLNLYTFVFIDIRLLKCNTIVYACVCNNI